MADVILEVSVRSWTEQGVRECTISNASASFEVLFGQPLSPVPGFWTSMCLDAENLVRLLMARLPSSRGEM